MKKKIILISSIALTVAVFLVILFCTDLILQKDAYQLPYVDKTAFEEGKQVKNIETQYGSAILLYINKEPITRTEFETYKIFNEYSDQQTDKFDEEFDEAANSPSVKTKDDKYYLDTIIKEQVIIQDAKKRGISVSDEEISDYTSTISTQLTIALKTGKYDESTIKVLSYMEGSGMTIDQYTELMKNKYTEYALYRKAIKAYIDTLSEDIQNSQELFKSIENYVTELTQRAEISFAD